MENPLISVLLPCYNTKKYLSKCIDSILNQTYENCELIIISDGSTDGSNEIMKEYAEKDNRIHLILRENKGIAITRNELLSKANGDYLIFVDSDDTISKYMLEDMLKVMNEDNADLVMCPARIVHEDTIIDLDSHDISLERKASNKVETLFNMIADGNFYDYPVAKLYSRKSLENIEFPTNRVYEDTSTLYKIYYNIDKSVVLTFPYYNYLVGRDNSITTKKYTMKNLNDNYLAIKERYDFLIDKVPELKKEAKLGYIRNILTLLR